MLKQPSDDVALAFLKRAEHFKEANDDLLREVIRKASWKAVPSRQILLRQGQRSSQIFILYSGQLNYEKVNASGVLTARGEFGSGEIGGEISFFRKTNAVATVYAPKNSLLLTLSHEDFENFLLKCPRALLSITQKAIHIAEISLSNYPKARKYSSLAIVPLEKHLNLETFCQSLAKSLATYGKVGCLSKSYVENKMGQGNANIDPQDPSYTEKLERLSRYADEHDFILLESDFEVSNWSKATTDEADRILLVAKANSPQQLSELEKKLISEASEKSPRFELVLLRSDNEQPSNSIAHLENRKIERVHHIREKSPTDFDRLARILTGNSIGLALGGGGVRACSQIGLLKAFSEAGIPVDHICGTSIGSLIGALYASGFSTEEMEVIVQEKIVNSNLFNDYTLPFVSIVKGKKFSGFLQDIYKKQLIEDMPIDYFSVATNLSTGTLDVFDTGLAWKAVRASASLPAILPPYVNENGVYVDGGLLDNLPGEVLRRRGVGKIVAVDVGSAQSTEKDKNLRELLGNTDNIPKNRKFLKNKYSRSSLRYSSIGDVVARSMVVGSRDTSEKIKENATLYIRMPVDKYGMLEFKSSAELIEVGYHHALKNIDAWKKRLFG